MGDIESLPFLEAIRQFKADRGAGNVLYIHVTLVPHIKSAGEMKTKPTQHSVKELREIGIQPDILLCRCERDLPHDMKAKIALFCNVEEKEVITAKDAEHIYEVPLALHLEGLDEQVVEKLNIWTKAPDLTPWQEMVEKLKNPSKGEVRIAIVGKYVNLTESYKSLAEALTHGGIANDCRVHLSYLDSEKIEQEGIDGLLEGVDGILVPGGFGERGTEGKIKAIEFARTRKIPFFGICLGMQMAVVEYARNVCGLEDAFSTEFKPDCANPVIHLMEGQKGVSPQGWDHASRRLSLYPGQGDHRPEGLRRNRDLRAAPPSLRIQQRIPGKARFLRPGAFRHLQGRGPGGDGGDRRSPLVCRLPVPSRIQIQAP